MEDRKTQWWWPTLVNDAYFERLRNDYPDKAEWPDDKLADYFEVEIGGFSDTWDNLGDARDEYEKVASHMLNLQHEADLHAELMRAADSLAEWVIALGGDGCLTMDAYNKEMAIITAYQQAKEKLG